jgi:hypothetical protein
MSKLFFLGSVIIAYIAVFVLSFIAGIASYREGVPLWEGSAADWMLLSVIVTIYLIVIILILWWKAWKSMQPYGCRTTPGQAVGFLFIPVVNFYWIFQAFWGYAKDFNANIDEYNLDIPRLPEGLFLAHTLVILLTGLTFWIPLLNTLLGLANIVVTILVVNKVVDSINYIRSAPLPEKKGMIF